MAAAASWGAPAGLRGPGASYREGVVIARPLPGAVSTVDTAERAEGLSLRARYDRLGGIRVITLGKGDTAAAAIRRLMATGRYQYVEPDYVRHAVRTPNDAQFSSQWALHNDGSGGGIAGADIDALNAWNVITEAGSGVVVGILDSGVNNTHEDLAANLWTNPNPISTVQYTTVSDANGSTEKISITDSTNGLNAVSGSGIPTDTLGHGTHVSGIVGAVGDNGVGVCGVAWGVQLMELKFLDGENGGTVTDELPCIDYAIQHHVSVINASFGDAGFAQAEMDAIYKAGQAGIIFVCAAGNSSENVDISSFFPADYPLDNIIAVGASDNRDLPAYFSNFGSGSVELFAPGDGVLSTFIPTNSSYMTESGTSMAAPFVTGAVALLRTQYPSDTYRETINRVLNSVDSLPALAGKCQTGGRLNLFTAVTTAPSTPPNILFADRTVLVGLDPYTRSNNLDSPVALEAGTPVLAAGSGRSLWWQWTAPEDAAVEVDTSGTEGGVVTGGSSYPTALGVYTGSSLGSLVVVATSLNYGTEPVEGGASQSYSEVKFHAVAGTTYQVNIQGQGGAGGPTVLAINTTPDNDAFGKGRVLSGLSATVVGANPDATREAGEPLILGNAGGHSLWYQWTAPESGSFAVSGYSYDFAPEVAVYTATSASPGVSNLSLVSAEAGAAQAGSYTLSSGCTCQFAATYGTTYYICLDGVSADDVGEFTLTIDDSLWQQATGDAVTCSPSVGPDGTLYVGGDDNSLYAYTPGGLHKWSVAGGSSFDTSSAAVGADGTVYAPNLDGYLYALTPLGAIRWKYSVNQGQSQGNYIASSPAVAADGTIYFRSSAGLLYALTPAGTAVGTPASVPGASYAAPTIAADGTVYIGTDGGDFYAFGPGLVKKWVYHTPVAGDQIYTAAAIDAAGNTYFGTLGGGFYSLDPQGNLRWSYSTGDGITSAPALANGSVYFGCYDGNLYALSTSGAFRWKCPVGAQVRGSAPAVDANGYIYIGSYDHNVYAVSPAGAAVRTFPTGDAIRSSPVISGTTLCFGSEDHKVYAFGIGTGPAAGDWPAYQANPQRTGNAVAVSVAAPPVSVAAATGSGFTLCVTALGNAGKTFQWKLNGAPIAGATNSTYTVAEASAANAGAYTVTVSSGTQSATSAPATVTVGALPGPAGRIVNLSARANVGLSSDALIAGFVVSGQGTKALVLRGVGPALKGYGVVDALASPVLSLFDSSSQLITQDTAWQTPPSVPTVAPWAGSVTPADATSAEFDQLGAFEFPVGSADTAIAVALPAGAFTEQIGANTGSGVSLGEIYDADTGTPTANLVNISARADVGSGSDILIAGFVVGGSQPVTVLLRGIGPTLANFGVSGTLAQPQIQLFNSAGVEIQGNSGWYADPTLAAAFSTVGAFALPTGSSDAAMVVSLAPGSYTLQLSGLGSSGGVGLVEVYLMP